MHRVMVWCGLDASGVRITFELLGAVEAPLLPGGRGIYLVSVRRCRFDNLPSGGLLNIRGRVQDQLTQLGGCVPTSSMSARQPRRHRGADRGHRSA